jgi:hypothetical protein
MVLSILTAMPQEESVEGTFAGGSGTAGDPYQISNADELQAMNTDPDACYILVNDIDCSGMDTWNGGQGFEPVDNFTGIFDGDGYVIEGLYINRPYSYVGLFESVKNGEIKNTALEDVDISSYGGGVSGGLAGYTLSADISGCHVTGCIYGQHFVGGLVGHVYSGMIGSCYSTTNNYGSWNVGGLAGYAELGRIYQSFATGIVNGTERLGGLVGETYRTSINDSFATGAVSGNEYIGGLVGLTVDSDIYHCYAAGEVKGDYHPGGLTGDSYYTSYTYSYWDIETSGTTYSAGGTGRTTAQMMQQATFVDWEFDGIWGIEEDETYPYLLPTGNDPESLIDELMDYIEGLDLPGNINSNPWLVKLENALEDYLAGEYAQAIQHLETFISQVGNQGQAQKMGVELSAELVEKAEFIIGLILEMMD